MTDITVNGRTYNDGAYDAVTNPLGLGNGGHRINLLPMLVDVMADATGSRLATSTSSVAIGTGSKSFTLATAVPYALGAYVRIASAASPANFMVGTVTAQAGTLLTVDVTTVGGAGTFAAWQVQITGAAGAAGSTAFIGLTDVPASFSGQALKLLRVNAGATAVEFADPVGLIAGRIASLSLFR